MSLEAEQAVVAAMLQSDRGYEQVSQSLVADDVTDSACQLIFEAVSKLREAGRRVDAIVVAPILDRSNEWPIEFNPFEYIDGLWQAAHGYPIVEEYIKILLDKRVQRQLLKLCAQVSELAYDNELLPENKIAAVHELVAPLAGQSNAGFTAYTQATKEAIVEIERVFNSGDGLIGHSTGFKNLDDVCAGFEGGDLVVLAGRPAMGKTAFALNLGHNVSLEGQVQIFSLEMPKAQMAKRTLAALSKVPLKKNT